MLYEIISQATSAVNIRKEIEIEEEWEFLKKETGLQDYSPEKF
ncbi:hypothetical protein SAMN05428949_3263 [Chitinophaga sp. YR627]|nr:hypothetical protein SAMN05428949_3263 [Chitinophaga sp. YR627]